MSQSQTKASNLSKGAKYKKATKTKQKTNLTDQQQQQKANIYTHQTFIAW